MIDPKPQAVREQVASVMRRAQATLGGREMLAKHLGVEPYLVGEWIAGISDPPEHAVDKALEVIVGVPRAS